MIAGNRRTVGATSDDVTGARASRDQWSAVLLPSFNRAVFQASMRGSRPTDFKHRRVNRILSRSGSHFLAVRRVDICLLRKQERRSHPHTASPKRKRSGNTPAICYAAGGNDRNSNGVTHEWD
jgi:hypothetical protein